MVLFADVRRAGSPSADDPREPLERIRRAARLVASGTLSPVQARHIAGEIERLAGILIERHASMPVRADGKRTLERLSDREREVFLALAGGETVQEVAFRFQRSPKTINNQRTSVLRKLGLRNSAELTRLAIQVGVLEV